MRSGFPFVAFLLACSPGGGSGPGDPPDGADGGTTEPPPPPPPADVAFFAPGVDPSVETLFSGADDPGRAPRLVYPTDGAFVPPNLNELEIHFTPGAGNVYFQISFELGEFRARVYTGCDAAGSGCAYAMAEDVWRTLSDATRGRGAIAVRIRGTDASGAAVGTSGPTTIELVQEDITGGLYYWNAPSGQIHRYDFGRRGAAAETFLDPARVGATECVGCHSLSRDGTRIAVALDEPNPSRVKVYDVETRAELYTFGGPDGSGANFFSFSPGNAEMIVSDGLGLTIRNGTTGAPVQTIPGIFGTMPDWSPDGSRVVFVERPQTTCAIEFDWEDWETYGVPCVFPSVESGSLGTLENVGGRWERGPALFAGAGANDFYPTYSPDGQWILFNRSPANRASYDVEAAMTTRDHELWVVSAAGGTPIRLGNAATVEGDAWPKWDPTEYVHRGEAVFWFTFATTSAYGIRPSPGTSRLWIAAFVPSRAAAGLDPTTPALYLPFQGEAGGNHIAQWVTRVERNVCDQNTDCGVGEFCEGGHCIAEGPI